jgi:hypothetical protein
MVSSLLPPASSLMFRQSLLALGALALVATAAHAQGRIVNVTASDFTLSLPDSLPAGVTTFNLVNKGTELHHMQILKLEQGKTIADFQAAMQQSHGPPPAWIAFAGGPQGGIPGSEMVTNVTVSLRPGNYVVLCFIPSPSDGKPHVAKGMIKPLKVTGTSATVSQAGTQKADYVLTLYDYNFDLDKPLKAGRRTIQIKNTSKQFHEAFIAKLPPNTPATALLEWMGAGMKGQPPAIPVGGIAGLTTGIDNFVTLDLEPGEYALYCFLPAPDGKEHVAHGMFKQITVVR